MRGKYICEYYYNSGEICGKGCIRPEGCHVHYKAKERKPCKECGKLTISKSEKCPLHIRGYYITQYYRRLREKVAKMEKEMALL